MDEIEVRLCQDNDVEQIVLLLDDILDWPRHTQDVDPVEHWKWKHRDNPTGASVVAVAAEREKIVGCSHLQLFRLRLGEREVLAGNGVDVVVDPRYRRRGLFNEMTVMRIEVAKNLGVDVILWSSANPILKDVWKKRSHGFPINIYDYVKIRDIDLHLRMIPQKPERLYKIGFHSLKALNNAYRLYRGRKEYDDIHIKAIDNFDERSTSLFQQIAREKDFMFVRDQSYLNWRFCDKRSGQHRIRVAEINGEMIGYCAAAINRYIEGYPVGFVSDIQYHPKRPEAAHKLLRDADEWFNKNDINLRNCLAPKKQHLAEILARQGYLNSRAKFILSYTDFTDEENLAKIGSPLFSFSDRDSLPITSVRRNKPK